MKLSVQADHVYTELQVNVKHNQFLDAGWQFLLEWIRLADPLTISDYQVVVGQDIEEIMAVLVVPNNCVYPLVSFFWSF